MVFCTLKITNSQILMGSSQRKASFTEYTYNVPKQYEMMSKHKFRLALGTAIAALIAAVVLGWIALNPKANPASAPAPAADARIIKNI